jgi:S-adenosylmethionine-dependent methyltransferase
MREFDGLALKLEKNVYGSAKGLIRMKLLEKDLGDFVPRFTEGGLRISDIGGGAGRFASLCAGKGHAVRLSDSSRQMLRLAEEELRKESPDRPVRLVLEDFLASSPEEEHDLYCLHGCVEWMENSRRALRKVCGEMPAGSYLSLLIFNSDRLTLKEGINGWLHPDIAPPKKRNLTPPGGLSPLETAEILDSENGTILLQSGIRIFHSFFRQFDPEGVSDEQWLEQEAAWYRKPPFNGLGEHSHFIWRKG